MNENTFNYAMIDDNNVVINVCVFAENDPILIEQVKNHLGAKTVLSCEEFGLAVVGGTWNGQHFLYEDGSRVPPLEMPSDDKFVYKYDFDLNKWVTVAPNRLLDYL